MKKAVLLINIGSPDAFTVFATRRYLQKFLMDRRVIDIPFILRFFLVNVIIAPFRASKSLSAYKKILIDEQSPLIYYSQQLEGKLQKLLGEDYLVKTAMIYGKPYLTDVLRALKREYLSEITIIPLYPQYASSTTGSALETVFKHIMLWQNIPNVRTVHTFYNNPEFIDLWVQHIKKHLPTEYDFILFSYHGLPVRQIYKADKQFSKRRCNLKNCCDDITNAHPFCYRLNCIQTTRLISEKLNIDSSKVDFCFQSRLGQSEWLKPYASEYLELLAKKGMKKIVVISPAFVTDCLETLFEIQKEYAELFKKHGGDSLFLIPSLNAEDAWVNFLSKQIKR